MAFSPTRWRLRQVHSPSASSVDLPAGWLAVPAAVEVDLAQMLFCAVYRRDDPYDGAETSTTSLVAAGSSSLGTPSVAASPAPQRLFEVLRPVCTLHRRRRP